MKKRIVATVSASAEEDGDMTMFVVTNNRVDLGIAAIGIANFILGDPHFAWAHEAARNLIQTLGSRDPMPVSVKYGNEGPQS